jgi:hypothetical protein
MHIENIHRGVPEKTFAHPARVSPQSSQSKPVLAFPSPSEPRRPPLTTSGVLLEFALAGLFYPRARGSAQIYYRPEHGAAANNEICRP